MSIKEHYSIICPKCKEIIDIDEQIETIRKGANEMKEEFDLSKKIDYGISCCDDNGRHGFIEERDVKEFIRLLKEIVLLKGRRALPDIDKLAGSQLTK